jgi:hypothetical protein
MLPESDFGMVDQSQDVTDGENGEQDARDAQSSLL